MLIDETQTFDSQDFSLATDFCSLYFLHHWQSVRALFTLSIHLHIYAVRSTVHFTRSVVHSPIERHNNNNRNDSVLMIELYKKRPNADSVWKERDKIQQHDDDLCIRCAWRQTLMCLNDFSCQIKSPCALNKFGLFGFWHNFMRCRT